MLTEANSTSANLLFVNTNGSSTIAKTNLKREEIHFLEIDVSKEEQKKQFFGDEECEIPVLYKATYLGGIDLISNPQALQQMLAAVRTYDQQPKSVDRQTSFRLGMCHEAPARLTSLHVKQDGPGLQHSHNVVFKGKEEGPYFNTMQFSYQRKIVRPRVQMSLPNGKKVTGLIAVTLKRFIFVPETDDPMVVQYGIMRYMLDIQLTQIIDCHLTHANKDIQIQEDEEILHFEISKEKKKKTIHLKKKPKETYAHEQHLFIKSYNFIINKKYSQEVYSKLTQQSLKSKEDQIQMQINLDVPLVKVEDGTHSDLEDLLDLLDDSMILTENDMVKKLYKFLPHTYRIQNLELLFTTDIHGSSMSTFYLMASQRGPTLLVLKDSQGFVFGYFSTEAWRLDSSYYGTGESFLWTLLPEFHVYQWTKSNEYFQFGDSDSLYMGGGDSKRKQDRDKDSYFGGSYGLWIGFGFGKGTSTICDTYFNRVLASSEEFLVDKVELWGFTNRSKENKPTLF